MPLIVDTTDTLAQTEYESGRNKAPRQFIDNYELGVYMMVTGVPVITKDSLPLFLSRMRLIQTNMGDQPTTMDPNVWEHFIGARANVSTITDAAFFKTLRENNRRYVESFRHSWEDRKPGTLSTVLGKDNK